MATTSNKTFDAVEMSRRLREQTSQDLASLTVEQRIALLNSHLRRNPKRPAVTYQASEESGNVLREEPPKRRRTVPGFGRNERRGRKEIFLRIPSLNPQPSALNCFEPLIHADGR